MLFSSLLKREFFVKMKFREFDFRKKKNREYNHTMVVYSNVEVSDFGNEEQHK